jgi:O-antigen/teichoic acid export membrane protein
MSDGNAARDDAVGGRRAVGRPMLWSSLESLSLAAVSFLVLAMLARYLDAGTFGRAAIALGAVQIACSFVESFFHNAVVQRKDLQPSDIDAAHTGGLLMALVLVVGIGAYGALALWRPDDGIGIGIDVGVGAAELALWMTPSVLLTAASAMTIAQLRRQLSMRPLALAMAGSRLVAGVATIVALAQGAGVWAMVLNQNLAALTLLVLLALVREPGVARPRLTRDLSGARRLAAFASWNSASGLLNTNLSRFFQVACGFVLPAAVVGQLALALRIVEMLVAVLVTGVSRVALSRLAAAAHEGRNVGALFIATTRRLCFAMLPVLLLMAVLAEPLVLFIGRAGWQQAAVLVAWFALAQALRSPVFMANTLFLGVGRPRVALFVSVAELASLALMTAVLQSPLAWVARLVVVLPLVLGLLHTRFGIGLPALLRAVRAPFVAALSMGALLHAALSTYAPLSPAPLATLLAGSLAGALIYALVAAALLGAQRVSAAWRHALHPVAGRS